MKVLFVNLHIGSGVEVAGDTYREWIYEAINESITYIEYNKSFDFIKVEEFSKFLIKENPDIIIVNESFEVIMLPIYFHKLYKNIKIIHILYLWTYLYDYNISHIPTIMHNSYYELCDKIFITNYLPLNKSLPSNFNPKKFYNTSQPVNPDKYNIVKKWKNRDKMFCYIGNIIPQKLSLEFIKEIKKTSIKIDCYGKIPPLDGKWSNYLEYNEEYIDNFNSCENLNYMGVLKFEDVEKIFNEYKYFILPTSGQEPFNQCLLQAIYCGTIPLVVNDRTTKKFDYTWIDWAKGLYLNWNKVNEFIENLINIVDKNPDYSNMSENIRNEAIKKFNYAEYKSEFIRTIKESINECRS